MPGAPFVVAVRASPGLCPGPSPRHALRARDEPKQDRVAISGTAKATANTELRTALGHSPRRWPPCCWLTAAGRTTFKRRPGHLTRRCSVLNHEGLVRVDRPCPLIDVADCSAVQAAALEEHQRSSGLATTSACRSWSGSRIDSRSRSMSAFRRSCFLPFKGETLRAQPRKRP